MKPRHLALVILLAVPSLHAATYYVAPPASGGNDSNPGSLASPYATIQRAANVAAAGDTVFIRAGTYRETITPANSGTVGARIIYQNYNNESVTISGADVITSGSWSLDSGSIYKAPLAGNFFTSSFNQATQVFVDGVMVTLAKWPNTTTKTNAYPSGTAPAVDISHPAKSVITSFVSKTVDSPSINTNTGVVTDTALPPRPAGFYNGAEIYFQPNNNAWSWILSGVVTNVAANGNQITFTTFSDSGKDFNPAIYDPASRYYLFNKKEFLDVGGEWWHDKTNGQLYLWAPTSANPATSLVEVKKRDYAFNLTSRSYITIQGLNIFASMITTDSGSGGSALGYDGSGNTIYPWRAAGYLAPSTGIVIDGIRAQYLNHFTDVSGHFFLQWGTCTGIVLSGTGHTIRNSTIEKTAGNGVELLGTGHTVFNNTLNDIAYAGTDASAVNTVAAGTGTDHVISYNTIRRTGRSAITPRSHGNSNAAGGQFKARYHHNDIAYFGLQDWDVGGFYVAFHDAQFVRIDHNLVSEGRGFISAGIYLDYTKNYIINHNVVWNVEWGIKVHGSSGGENNTLVYNNTSSVRNLSSTPYGPFAIGNGSGTNVGTVLRNNILTVATPPAATGYEAIGAGLSAFSGAEAANNLAWNGVANSSTDPRFVSRATTLDATGVNYTLQTGSAAIDTGTVIGTYTRNGVTVPPFPDATSGAAPDRGAYEFGVPAWIAGATPARCVEPISSPWTGSYTAAISVTLTTDTPGATIRYTTDGSTPTSTTGTVYSAPFTVSTTTTVKTIAVLAGLADSTIASYTYTITPPPVSNVSAASLSADLTTGTSVIVPLILGNTGIGPLNYTLSLPATDYSFKKSGDSGGPTYTWQDISSDTTGGGSGTGGGTRLTALNSVDNASTAIGSMGLTFPFYGTNFTSVNVCTNGFLSFTSTATTATNSSGLPNTTSPANLIAPLFMDLRTDASSAIYYKLQDANTFIIQYQNLRTRNQTSQRATFQVVLRSSGEIEYRYNATSITNLTQTIGIQDSTRTRALQIVFNPTSAYISANFAIKISPPQLWFGATPTSGSVLGGDSVNLLNTFTAGSLALGTYTATLTINSNDSTTPMRAIPVTLNIVASVTSPTTPGSPSITAATATTGATLAWTSSTNHTSYQIERSADNSVWTTIASLLPPSSTTYTDSAPSPGIWYYRIRAVNGGGSTATASLTSNFGPPSALAYESFTQSVGTSLSNTASSGIGLGLWTTATGSDASVVAGSLVYSASSQSTLAFGQTLRRTGFGQSRLALNLGVGSPLSNAGFVTSGALGGTNADGKTLYLSFLVSGAALTNDTLVVLENAAANQLLAVRAQQNMWAFQRLAGLQALTTITPDAATTYLMVVRINYAAGNDTMRLYINPASLGSEPVSANASFNDFALDTVTSLSFFTNSTGTWSLDEVRIGTSWTDVVQPRPSSITGIVAAPDFSPVGGNYTSTQSVTLSTATSGATLRYTTDGSTPTSTTGTVYSGAITVASTTTLKAIAYKSGLADSSVVTATYTITPAPTGVQTFRSANSLPANGSQDLLTPAGDGVANILKFAFNMLGTGGGQASVLGTPNSAVVTASGSAGLPLVDVDGTGKLRVTYVRRKSTNNSGISYVVEFSDTLANGTWAVNASATTVVTSIDTTFERVVVTDANTSTRRFVRVRVSSP